jgi:LysW-gamma-L-lysine carboxypeptidase
MKASGFDRAFSDEVGNAVGVIGDGPGQIVLLGHIDTVPGEIPIRISPLPKGEGAGARVLYGRGSVDAKGPLAAFTDAAAKVGRVEGWEFVVIGALDEERDSLGARHVVDQYRPDFAIIGEPSRWNRITLGYKGCANAEILVQRQVEHAAGQSKSAPETAVDVWNRIQAWADEFNRDKDRVFEQVSPTLRGFCSERDPFQAWARLNIGARLPLGMSPAAWQDQLQALVAPEKVHPTGFSIPAYKAERNSPLVRAFLGAIRAEGQRPGFVVKTGTADLNIVAPVWDCPAVAYGPGDSSLDHTPDEHLSLRAYHHAVKVLMGVLQGLTSNQPPKSKKESLDKVG